MIRLELAYSGNQQLFIIFIIAHAVLITVFTILPSFVLVIMTLLINIYDIKTHRVVLYMLGLFVSLGLLFLFLWTFPLILIPSEITMLFTDRSLNASYFDLISLNVENCVLFQYLFYFFIFSEIYIVLLPILGIVYYMVEGYNKKIFFVYFKKIYTWYIYTNLNIILNNSLILILKSILLVIYVYSLFLYFIKLLYFRSTTILITFLISVKNIVELIKQIKYNNIQANFLYYIPKILMLPVGRGGQQPFVEQNERVNAAAAIINSGNMPSSAMTSLVPSSSSSSSASTFSAVPQTLQINNRQLDQLLAGVNDSYSHITSASSSASNAVSSAVSIANTNIQNLVNSAANGQVASRPRNFHLPFPSNSRNGGNFDPYNSPFFAAIRNMRNNSGVNSASVQQEINEIAGRIDSAAQQSAASQAQSNQILSDVIARSNEPLIVYSNFERLTMLFDLISDLLYGALLASSRVLGFESQMTSVLSGLSYFPTLLKVAGSIITIAFCGGFVCITLIYTWKGGKQIILKAFVPMTKFIIRGIGDIIVDLKDVSRHITSKVSISAVGPSKPIYVPGSQWEVNSNGIQQQDSFWGSKPKSRLFSTCINYNQNHTQNLRKYSTSLNRPFINQNIFKNTLCKSKEGDYGNILKKKSNTASDFQILQTNLLNIFLTRKPHSVIIVFTALQLIGLYYIYSFNGVVFNYIPVLPYEFFNLSFKLTFGQLLSGYAFVCIFLLVVPIICYSEKFPKLSRFIGNMFIFWMQTKTITSFILTMSYAIFKSVVIHTFMIKEYIANQIGVSLDFLETVYKQKHFVVKLLTTNEEKIEILRTLAINQFKKLSEINPFLNTEFEAFKIFLENALKNLNANPEQLILFFKEKTVTAQIIKDTIINKFLILETGAFFKGVCNPNEPQVIKNPIPGYYNTALKTAMDFITEHPKMSLFFILGAGGLLFYGYFGASDATAANFSQVKQTTSILAGTTQQSINSINAEITTIAGEVKKVGNLVHAVSETNKEQAANAADLISMLSTYLMVHCVPRINQNETHFMNLIKLLHKALTLGINIQFQPMNINETNVISGSAANSNNTVVSSSSSGVQTGSDISPTILQAQIEAEINKFAQHFIHEYPVLISMFKRILENAIMDYSIIHSLDEYANSNNVSNIAAINNASSSSSSQNNNP